MKLALRNAKSITAIEDGIRELIRTEAPVAREPEIDTEIAPFVQKIAASSIADIERLMDALQGTKDFLQSEAERIQREVARFTDLTQTASASMEIIFDTVHEWRKVEHPVPCQLDSDALESLPAQSDNTGEMCSEDGGR
jgi:predicted  nucleic acid-binding Zn-ribbon protein